MLFFEPIDNTYETEEKFAIVNAAYINKYDIYKPYNSISSYGRGIGKYTGRGTRGRGTPNSGCGFDGGRHTRLNRNFGNQDWPYPKAAHRPIKGYVQCDGCTMGNHICPECRFTCTKSP